MNFPFYCADPKLAARGEQICRHFDFDWVERMPTHGHALVLQEDDTLALHSLDEGAPGPVWVDFAGGGAEWRRRFGGGRNQAVAKACGLKGGANPYIMDATAGFAKDAFVLAALGCKVEMIERSPIAASLLADGLLRAGQTQELKEIAARMHLRHGSAVEVMSNWHGAKPDVVYLDPMFPDPKAKSALSKKDMQAFQAVVGPDADADSLLAPARALASFRVVVKRPRRAPDLAGVKPSFSMEGDSVRFDVYLR